MNQRCLEILQRCYHTPFTLQSNYAREHSKEVAELASRGLLTTRTQDHTPCEKYGNVWRVTAAGLCLIEYYNGEI